MNAETNYALELHGAGSLCFEHGSPEGNTGVGAESDTCDCFAVDAEINYALELYGGGSLCFEHGSPWTVQHCGQTFPVDNWGSGCYQVLLG